MPAQAAKYRFGPYELHARTRELYKYGTRLRLRPQPFVVLQLLAESAPDCVTREELRQEIWPAKTFVDFEHGLNTSVKELRHALCDSASEPRYIETLPKLGYRMIVPVEAEREEPTALAATIPAAAARAVSLKRWWLILALLPVMLLNGSYWQKQYPHSGLQAGSGRTRLAVLPFDNLTGDETQEYWIDGLTEEMIANAGRLDPRHLEVIAHTSVMQYRHSQERPGQIGRELGVQYVLKGSIRTDPGHVRVSTQLMRVNDERQVWTRQYDLQSSSLAAVDSHVAHEIADEIQFALGSHERSAPTPRRSLSPQQSRAYDLYLKGLYFWNKRTVDGFQKAIASFQQAIARDPNDARPYAGLANCFALIGGYSGEPRVEYAVQARIAARRALQLDETLPESHVALAVVVQDFDWDWQTAEKEFRRAIELNPSYATAYHWYAEHLGFRGRFDEAFRESERARQLDPLSLIIARDYGVLLYYARRYDQAVATFQAIHEMDPNFGPALFGFYPYIEKGMFGEAQSELERVQRQFGRPASLWAMMAYAYGRSGQREQAWRATEKAKQLYLPGRTDPTELTYAYLGLDNKDEAINWLEKAYSQHANSMTALKVDPAFDGLRSDPRFQDLVRRVGLAP